MSSLSPRTNYPSFPAGRLFLLLPPFLSGLAYPLLAFAPFSVPAPTPVAAPTPSPSNILCLSHTPIPAPSPIPASAPFNDSVLGDFGSNSGTVWGRPKA